MNIIYQVLGYPLGWVMWALYSVVRNYGLALLVFTILTKLALFPISLKQQKSSAKMMIIQPRMTEIQERYKNDKEKLNQELMKLYEKEKYNPMSGCLPMLIQFPVLFGIIDVVYKPLYHILRLPKEVIEQAQIILADITGKAVQVGGLGVDQLNIIRGIKADPTPYMALGQDVIEKIQNLNLNFLWMDLTMKPDVSMFGEIFTNFNPILLIPILSGLSALASSLQSMKNTASDKTNSTMKGMMYMMPIFSLWIAFSVPAGVGLYWFYSNITSMIQMQITNRIYNPKELAEKAKIEHEEQLERERQERIEMKKKRKEATVQGEEIGEDLTKGMTAKEISRRKLAEARRRDAEKYGEEYVEVTDEDLR